MNPHLFVYGSLMSAAGHPMGARLAGEGRLLGPASMAGQLLRVSWYPGLVEGGDEGGRVHGEVHALGDPARALQWLDAYEGIVPGRDDGEYRREQRTVRLGSGEELIAWVYIYRGPAAGLAVVPGGRWVPQPP